jgi:hypothetical protein
MSATEVCAAPFARWKLPKLSSVPAGIAAGLITTARTGPGSAGLPGNDMTFVQPAGAGSEEQNLPTVTMARMPSRARSLCRVPGSSSTFRLMVSVAVPLALLTSVNAAVRIVPVPCADGEPVSPRPSTIPAPATPAADRPPGSARRQRPSRAGWTLAPARGAYGDRHISYATSARSSGIRFVHGFVHETRRDRLGRRRCEKPETTPRWTSAEVNTTTRDGPETAETCVVWLITQRSRVQIPPPLPRPEGPFSNRERAL